jgi:hypothetical protein
MNMPEDPRSVLLREGEQPMPPVEGAWSRMEKKLDMSIAPNRATPAKATLRHFIIGTAAAAAVGVFFLTNIVLTTKKHPASSTSKNHPISSTAKSQTPLSTAKSHPLPSDNAGSPSAIPDNATDPSKQDAGPSPGATPRHTDPAVTTNPTILPPAHPGKADKYSNVPGGDSATALATGKHSSATGAPNRGFRPSQLHSQPSGTSSSRNSALHPHGITAHDDSPLTTHNACTPVGIQPSPDQAPVAAARPYHILSSGSLETIRPMLPIRLTTADPLVRVAATKHLKGGPTIRKHRSPAQYPQIPRFSAGITLKQYLPLSGQQFNDYWTDGRKYILSDYIPAVFIRAALSKRSYLQASVGLLSPQYTQHMMIDSVRVGTSTVPGYAAYLQYEDHSLKKLFYNELALTYHYQIAPRWRAGVGVQVAFLAGGTVEDQTILRPTNPALADTLFASRTIGLGNRSYWQGEPDSRTDWRGVVEMEYCTGRWTFGLRYQQTFRAFYFDDAIPSYGQTTTNNSLSIRASYALWESNRR